VTWSKLFHVLRNATARGHARTVLQKLAARARGEHRQARRATPWCASVASRADRFVAANELLWSEAESFAAALEARAEVLLRARGFDAVGSGAHCALLYFLTRHTRPRSVLETGVAAGYASAAVLAALERNGAGRLFSSDFPYLRSPRPYDHIGCLVDPSHRHRWRIELVGDRVNVPLLLAGAGPIDLFHYDSDKSYSGRKWVFSRVLRSLSPGAVVVMDDVQDNLFFKDWIEREGWPYAVLPFRDKYVGVAGRRLNRLFPTNPP
jgi:predicted O-methyltransferase YrrM